MLQGVSQSHGACHSFECSRVWIFLCSLGSVMDLTFLGAHRAAMAQKCGCWEVTAALGRCVLCVPSPPPAMDDHAKMALDHLFPPFVFSPPSLSPLLLPIFPPFPFSFRSFACPSVLHPCLSVSYPCPSVPPSLSLHLPSLSHFLFFIPLLFNPVLNSLPGPFVSLTLSQMTSW